MHSEGVEPSTFGSEDRCSIQLSYGRKAENAVFSTCFRFGHRCLDGVGDTCQPVFREVDTSRLQRQVALIPR